MTDTATVTQIVNSVIGIVAVVVPITSAIAVGATEFAKKVFIPVKYAGLFSYVASFAIAILLMGVLTSSYFGGLSILVACISVFIPAGLYSGIKAATTSEKASEQTV